MHCPHCSFHAKVLFTFVASLEILELCARSHLRDYGAQFDSETLVNYSDVVRWEDFFHCNIISTIDCHLQHCYVCILSNIDLQMDFQLVSNFSVCTKPHGNHHRAAGDDHGGDDDDQYHDDD